MSTWDKKVSRGAAGRTGCLRPFCQKSSLDLRRGQRTMLGVDFSDKAFYINRELSWLEFNQRVLDQALDESNPLILRAVKV